MKLRSKLILTFVFSVFLISFASAGLLDGKNSFKDKADFKLDKKTLKYNELWDKYNPIEVKSLFGKTKWKGAIIEHTEVCGSDLNCFSTMEIYLAEEGSLVDYIEFRTLQDNGKWVEQPIRWYKFEYWGEIEEYGQECKEKGNYSNGTVQLDCKSVVVGSHMGWISYKEGQILQAGEYTLKLSGEKKPSRTVDWIIDTQGKTINEWAVWGNISLGDEAEIILNSPADSSTAYSNEVLFNATANVTGGANLVNMSLWTNESGSWTEYNSTNITPTNIANPTGIGLGSDTASAGAWVGTCFIVNQSSLLDYAYIPVTGITNARLSRNETNVKTGTISGNQILFEDYLLETGYEYCISMWDTSNFNYGRSSVGTVNYPVVSSSGRVNYTRSHYGLVNQFNNYDEGTGSTFRGISNLYFNNYPSTSTQTFNRTITDDIIWNVQACDSDGDCGFATSNYSLSIDSSSPLISLISPTGTYDYLKEGSTLYLTGFANDTNLDTVWYEYNGTNTTISGVTTETLFNESVTQSTSDKTSLTVWANDSVGNVNSQEISWGYKIFENNLSYNAFVTETSSQQFNISISYNSSDWNSIIGTLSYDSTNYTATQHGSGNAITFSRTIDIPTITGTSENKTFRWYFTLVNSTNSYFFSSDTYQQNVSEINVHICGAGETAYLNFTTYNAENPFPIINGTFKSSWELWTKGGSGLISTFSYEDITEENSTWNFCITPQDNYTITVDIEVDSSGFAKNFYYIEEEDYTVNSTQNISLYLLNDTEATPTTLRARNRAQARLPGVLIYIDLYDVGTDDYYTVGMAKTNNNGEDVSYLNWYDTLYRFRLFQEGVNIYSTNDTKIFATPKIFEIDSEVDFSFDKFRDFDYTLTFDNSTKIFTLTFVKPSGEVDQGCLKVIKRSAQNDTDICETCLEASTGVINCDVSAYGNGTFIAAFYATGSFSLVDLLTENIGKTFAEEIFDLLDKDDSAFYAILMAGIVVAMFLITPVLGIIGAILGLLAISAMGFAVMSYTYFAGIVIIGIVIIWILKS